MTTTLTDLDLFSLMVFDSIYETQHANVTARQLGVSASKISRCLNALRVVFDDELFYRRQAGLLPTPLAERLHPQVHHLVNDFELLQQLASPVDELRIKLAVIPTVLPVMAEVLQLPEYAELAQKISLSTWRSESASELHLGRLDVGLALEKPEFRDLDMTTIGQFGGVNLVARNGHPIWALLERFQLELMADYPFLYQVMVGFNDKQDPLEAFFNSHQVEHSGIEPIDGSDDWYARLLSSNALSFVGPASGLGSHQEGLRYWRLPDEQFLRLHDGRRRPELVVIERQQQYRRYSNNTHDLIRSMSAKIVSIMK